MQLRYAGALPIRLSFPTVFSHPSPQLAVSQFARCDAALIVLDHNSKLHHAYHAEWPHDAPWMPTIGEYAKDGLDDPVIPTVLLISDSLNERPPSLWNENFHFSLAPAAEQGMAVANLVLIE
jgi:hypothetical protein